MHPMTRFRVVVFVAIGALALAGCGGEQPSSSSTASESASVEASESAATSQGGPLAGSPLIGTFRTTVGANDFNTPTGDWQLRIDEAGMTFVQPDGFDFSPGDVVSVSASEVVFAADPECPTQEGIPTEGTYTWALDDALVFTVVSDTCRDRAALLTQAPWEPAD